MAQNEKHDGGEVAADQQPTDPSEQTLQNLKEERDSLYDRLLRKQAEFENYKKRIEREKSEYYQFASAELVRELLTALDSFELALENAAGDQNMIRGFELIYKQIFDTLTRFGLKRIEAQGEKFDPHYHQAVSTEPTGEVEENTVIREMRKGYLLNGRLLRPAMVMVSAKRE